MSLTQYGFRFGPMVVSRLVSDEGWGVLISIVTPRQAVDIRATPTGLIRIGDIRKPYEHEFERQDTDQ